jgi:hypothetical protein
MGKIIYLLGLAVLQSNCWDLGFRLRCRDLYSFYSLSLIPSQALATFEEVRLSVPGRSTDKSSIIM